VFIVDVKSANPWFLVSVNVLSLYVYPVTKVSVIPVTKPHTSKVVPLFVTKVTHPVVGLYVPPVTFMSLSLNNAAEFVTLNVPPVVFVNDSCWVPAFALPLETWTSTTLPVYELKVVVGNLVPNAVSVSPVYVLNKVVANLASNSVCKFTTSLILWVCAELPKSDRFILPFV